MSGPLRPPAVLGFVGLGNMGGPMVGRLVDAGYGVRAYDTAAEAGAQAAALGAHLVGEVADVAAGADAVLLMLPSSAVVDAVLHQGGLSAALAPGALLVDMGSSQPTSTRGLAAEAAAAGRGYVDAPVSGGVRGAQRGALTVMVGGAEEHVERARPVLEVLGSSVRHVGPAGAGHAIKALNNLMSAAHLQATSEAMLVAREFGLDLGTVLDVVDSSSGQSGSTRNKWPNFVLPGTFDSGFGLRLMLKDMRIAQELARETGVPTPLADQAITSWAAAADELPAQADHTELVRWLESLRATEVTR